MVRPMAWDFQRATRSLPVAYKILLPFLLLTLASGLSFAGAAAYEMTAGATAQADNTLVRDTDAVALRSSAFQSTQVVALQLIESNAAVPSAVETQDREQLEQLLLPVLVSQPLPGLRVSVVAPDGTEILTLRQDPSGAEGCLCTYGRHLLGRSDPITPITSPGAPEEGVADAIDGPVVYTLSPVFTAAGPVGALMVAQPLNALVTDLAAAGDHYVAFYFADGTLLAASAGFPAEANLGLSQRYLDMAGELIREANPGSAKDQVAFVRWSLGGRAVGYAGVAVPKLGAELPGRLLVLLALTLAAAIGCALVGGVFVSRAIGRPLARLVDATREIAHGRLPAPVQPAGDDEIGRLAASINFMTASLSENRAALERTMNGTLETLAAAIDARDPYTYGHSYRVADYAVAVGTSLGLDSKALALLRRACLVHDIGKIGVPDSVLLKVGPLTAEERATIEAHPVIGHRVLSHLAWEPDILDVVRHHHERWDGGGYPDRLVSTAIPRLARIAALADALDAMVTARVYRRERGFDDALMQIREGSGYQFDPDVVASFLAAELTMRGLVAEVASTVQGIAV